MCFFTCKVVIVTGSSNGIGRGTAVLFAKEGAKVTITGRKAEALEETKQLCLRAGAKEDDLLELLGNVTDETFNERLISATVEKFGKLDVLVNNAGGTSLANLGKGILDALLAELDEMMELNVKSILRLSQLSAPHLAKTKGAIVNVSSIGAFHKVTPMPYYCVAKSTLDHITVQMAGSLIKQGIRVNSVNPGPVLTSSVVPADAHKDHKKAVENLASSMIPLGRIGMPEDIGKVILFLADRSQSEIIIGHILTADGGCSLKSALFPDS